MWLILRSTITALLVVLSLAAASSLAQASVETKKISSYLIEQKFSDEQSKIYLELSEKLQKLSLEEAELSRDFLLCATGNFGLVYKIMGGPCISLTTGWLKTLSASTGLDSYQTVVELAAEGVLVSYLEDKTVSSQTYSGISVGGTSFNFLKALKSIFSGKTFGFGVDAIVVGSEKFGTLTLSGIKFGAGVDFSGLTVTVSNMF